MLVITPLALLMGQTANEQPVGELLFDRGVETVIGSGVGLGLVVVLYWHRRPPRPDAARPDTPKA